jgi:hypothetical protein
MHPEKKRKTRLTKGTYYRASFCDRMKREISRSEQAVGPGIEPCGQPGVTLLSYVLQQRRHLCLPSFECSIVSLLLP